MRRRLTNISYLAENTLIFILKMTFFYSLFALVPWFVAFKVLQLFFGDIPLTVNVTIFLLFLLWIAYYFERKTSLLDMPLHRHMDRKIIMRTHSHYIPLTGLRRKYLVEYAVLFVVPFLIITYLFSRLLEGLLPLFLFYLFVALGMMLCFFFSYLAKASGRKRRIYDLKLEHLSVMDYYFRPLARIALKEITRLQMDERKKTVGIRTEEHEIYIFPSRYKEFVEKLSRHTPHAGKESTSFADGEKIEKKDYELDS